LHRIRILYKNIRKKKSDKQKKWNKKLEKKKTDGLSPCKPKKFESEEPTWWNW
jgi:hypothetical protein